MKLYKQILILFCLFLSVNIKGQFIDGFYGQINLAIELTNENKIDSAIIIYESAFDKINYVHTKFLEKVVKLAKLNKDQERVSRYEKQIKKQIKGTNPELIKILDSLDVEDQKVRSEKFSRAYSYYLKCNKDVSCYKKSKKYIRSKLLVDRWSKVDSLNIYHLLNLFKEYGFIGEELVGSKSSHNVILLLIHFDKDTNNSVLEPILKKAINEGKVLPLHAAQFIDRHLFNHNGTQKYWTWNWNSKGKKFPFSESDLPKIIELRESIGIYGSELWQEKKGEYWVIRNKYNY
ncbi:MAG: hypothetical protein COB15_09775 [Flavobacteriales bacterium]|nr:MAG: hypothetical protein COB15_09775 [Flavobacteriales bacterium]